MSVDKKAARGKLRFVVLQAIGEARLRGDADEKALRDVIVAAAQ
jgi:3-dehydroquinate synthetase